MNLGLLSAFDIPSLYSEVGKTHITGKLISITACHSAMFSGTIENKDCRNGV